MENSPELKALIRKNAHLFWYIKDSAKEVLPLSVVVEFFLNYATKEDVKALFSIAGIEKVRDVFYAQINTSERMANNYFPVTRNFFKLYFDKYAPGNFG